MVRRSTGERSKRAAQKVAMGLEAAAKETAGAVGDKKARAVQAIVAHVAEDAARDTLTAQKARAAIEEILKLTSGEALVEWSVAGWAKEWLARKRPTVSKATVQRYEASVKAFLTFLKEDEDRPLSVITTATVRKWRDHLRIGRTARTTNHYVKDITGLFKAAIDEGIIAANPCGPLKALPLEDSRERKPFYPGEVGRLIESAPSADWRGVILVGAFTGLRLGDCASLTWGHVDLAAGIIAITPSKTRRKRIEVRIPLHPQVQGFLESHPISDDDDAPLFPSLAKRSVSGAHGLSLTFAGIMDAAGVSRGKCSNVGRKNHERGFHSLRHTFTSWLSNAGVSQELRQAMTGHLDDGSHKLYTHHDFELLKGAVERLPRLSD